VELACQGEDVLITVRGKVKARLTRVMPPSQASDRAAWVRELRALHKKYGVARPKCRVEEILAQTREDRVWAVTYWDTSALLKLYVTEEDSPTFLKLVSDLEGPILSSVVVGTEVLCTLYHKEHAGDLKPGAAGAVFRQFMADVTAANDPPPWCDSLIFGSGQ